MDKLNIDNCKNNNLEMSLKKDYIEALKNEDFKKLVVSLKIKDDIAYKYTSKLEDTVCELKNCSKCKNLSCCKNQVEGHVYYPVVYKDTLDFVYKPCKYFKEKKDENKTFHHLIYYKIKI